MQENFYYLSGLLIGAELKELTGKKYTTVTLISNKLLAHYYKTALLLLGVAQEVKIQNADEAIARGQLKVLNTQKIK